LLKVSPGPARALVRRWSELPGATHLAALARRGEPGTVPPAEAPAILSPSAAEPRTAAGLPVRRAPAAHRATTRDRLAALPRRLPPPGAALGLTRTGLGSLAGRTLARERAIPVAVAGLVLVASLVGVGPATGRPASLDAGAGPRLVVGGGVLEPTGATGGDVSPTEPEPPVLAAELGDGGGPATGAYLADGTLLKPVAVSTSVPDAADRLTTYTVAAGDTLTGIADRFGLSMMTLWWANHLSAKDELHVGQKLVIPPVDGLVVTVAAGDTLASIAARTGVDAETIVAFNDLPGETIVVGQTLIVPGALGAAIATPKPAPASHPTSSGGSSGSHVASGGGSGPAQYQGGKLLWPVAGGHISQYYHYGHWAIDIAAPYGTPVKAAAAGKVIFAGWKNNGGGYQVWLSHGSNLYTTYNHMSAILVHTGQTVSRGQQVGRIGMTGWATGPHLHFEVWRGMVWAGGVRVNPLAYL